jgi:hypothetical protein
MARVWKVPEARIEHMAEGLRNAGLDIAPMPGHAPEAG